MKKFWVVFGILCVFIMCSSCGNAMSSSSEQNAELEIRTAICEIENGNYKAAYATLESILKKEPKNIYALRLLPGVAARQIKQGDKSPENIAVIRKAVEDYERAAINPLFKNEREDINGFIITLYGMIGGDEKATALLRKAENESETPKQRAIFYTSLAADNYACANEVSDIAPVKSTIKRNGKEVYVFRKPQNPADFDRLKNCAAKGSELSARAVALDPASDSAWSYHANLSVQLARIAEMEGKPAEKARRMKEFETSLAKFRAILKKQKDEQRIANEKLSKSFDDDQSLSFAGLSDAQRKELAQELKSYRAERPLTETVDRIYIPSELFIQLAAPNDETTTEPARPDDENQTRELKTFSPEGAFSAELPVNASFSSSGDSRIYTASGNGLSFFILETTRSIELSENEQDAALNILAWILTKHVGGSYIGRGHIGYAGWNNRFESELTRKDKFNNLPARLYAYRMISCKEQMEGTMLFVLGGKKNYAIDIRGAAESDERVRRFLKSLKLD